MLSTETDRSPAIRSEEKTMSEHVIVGAGAVGSADCTAARRARRARPRHQPARQRTGAPRHRARGRRRDRRGAADRAGDRRRGALQLREPAVPPVVHRLAAAGLGAADGGRAQRRGAGRDEQPVRLRAGRRPDHAEDAARRDSPQAAAARRRCGRTRWPRSRRAGSARPRSAPATTSRPTRLLSYGDRQAAAGGQARLLALRRWTSRTAGRRSPTARSDPGDRRHRRAGLRPGVARPDRTRR